MSYADYRPMTDKEIAALYPREKLMNRVSPEPLADEDFGPLSKIASDFAYLEAEKSGKVDGWVNRAFMTFCAALIGYAVGLALGYW